MKKIVLFSIIVLIIAAGAFGIIRSQKKTSTNDSSTQNSENSGKVAGTNSTDQNQSELVLFYGEGCPHCKNVEEFISDNKIDEKLSIQKKEVWYNKENAKQMQEKADICKLPEDQLGVPFMFDGSTSKCYVGEDEVVNILKEKAGI